jgi:hypothetical protein
MAQLNPRGKPGDHHTVLPRLDTQSSGGRVGGVNQTRKVKVRTISKGDRVVILAAIDYKSPRRTHHHRVPRITAQSGNPQRAPHASGDEHGVSRLHSGCDGIIAPGRRFDQVCFRRQQSTPAHGNKAGHKGNSASSDKGAAILVGRHAVTPSHPRRQGNRLHRPSHSYA